MGGLKTCSIGASGVGSRLQTSVLDPLPTFTPRTSGFDALAIDGGNDFQMTDGGCHPTAFFLDFLGFGVWPISVISLSSVASAQAAKARKASGR